MFCWHVWKVTDRTEHPSCMDAMKDRGPFKAGDMEEFNRRPVIVSSCCEKCGTEKVERI